MKRETPMQLANDLLDLVMKKYNLDTDYQLAKQLNMHLQTIRNYRLGKTIPNSTMCLLLAEELREDPIRVMAKFKTLGAKTERERGVWERYAGRVLLVCIALTGQLMEANAQEGVKVIDQNIHYAHIFARILRRLCRYFSGGASHPTPKYPQNLVTIA